MTRVAGAMTMAFAIAGVCSWGCRSQSPEATSEKTAQPNAAAAAATAAPRPARNACALIVREQIEAIASQTLDMLHNIEADDLTICELTATGTDTLLVSVTVHWSGGKELARITQAAMSMGRQMLNEDDVDIEELTGSEKVRGLADKAYYSDLMPSWVLKGDVLIEVLSPRFGRDQTKRVFLAVAKEAMSRL